jgi:hypothetical protein
MGKEMRSLTTTRIRRGRAALIELDANPIPKPVPNCPLSH